ncbi:MAG: hypothetical protein ABIK09_13365 [Pseudomonadota bacterium]
MKTSLWLVPLTLLLLGGAAPAAAECVIEDGRAVVTVGGSTRIIDVGDGATSCLVDGAHVVVAAGPRGVVVYALDAEGGPVVDSWRPTNGEVVGLHPAPGGPVALTAHLEAVPLHLTADGRLQPAGLGALLAGSASAPQPASEGPKEAPVAPKEAVPPPRRAGTVAEVRGDLAVLDIGADAGVAPGDRFEIRSQELTRQYDLETGEYKLLPSNRISAVVQVTSVSADKALATLGRGDRARVGDLVATTREPTSGTTWFPGYERSLNRFQAKVGPYLGIDTLSAGMLTSAMYDRTFAFPLRVSAGFSNVGLVFGEDFAAPFHLEVVPSYDTDYFEVGLGLGYVFSSHERRRGLSFLQKVRLGTVDGLNLTVQNAFIYERRRTSSWFSFGGSASEKDVGEACTPDSGDEELTGFEFNWEGIDASIFIPLTRRVTLVTDWSYSNAGWFYGDLGIRTLVLGNGGSGTLIIPVTIGGVVLNDYVAADKTTYCDADANKVKPLQEYDTRSYAGPVVTIGVDYRWR